jgi:hypothetical protein
MSYTTIDCYYFGSCYPSEVRKYCLKHPLFIDVWEDIRFINEQEFAFTNPNRLFAFLMARALGHQELYQNPAARILDFFLTKLIQPLYQQGIITKENLLLWTTQQLEFELPKHYPPDKEVRPTYVTPGEYQWRWFPSEEELQDFCQKQKVDHTEHLKGFDSGLDWPVFSDKIHSQIVPLAEVLDREQISQLTEIVNSTIGYYAYWHTPDEQPLNF